MNASKHVVVTGAGTGIGRAIAQRLDRDGYLLTLVGRREVELRATETGLSGAAVVATADIGQAGDIEKAMDAGVAVHGALYGLVANAGLGGANEAGPEDRFDEIMATNLRGTYLSLRAAQARLGDFDEPGRMVAIGSILARIGVPGYTAYCASKAGVLGLVRAFALEVGPARATVNSICPGWVDTDMAWEGLDGMAGAMGISRDEAHGIAMQDVPIGRMGKPSEIAGMVAWLLGPDAAGTTGSTFDLNGGAWMG
jgi:NAD(P)-dependent dehydrogenase (short-subunit alcohol dehydrogenase family)